MTIMFDTITEALNYEPEEFTVDDVVSIWGDDGSDIDGLTSDERNFITHSDGVKPDVYDRLCRTTYTGMFTGCLSVITGNGLSTINRSQGHCKLAPHLLRRVMSPNARRQLTRAIKLAKLAEYGRLERSTLDMICDIYNIPQMPDEYEGFEVEYLMWHTEANTWYFAEHTQREFLMEDGLHWRHPSEYEDLPKLT